MVNANVNVFTLFFLLFDKPGRQTSTASINNGAALFLLYRRVQTQILSARKPECPELLLVAKLLCPVLHQRLQLRQGFLNFRHST